MLSIDDVIKRGLGRGQQLFVLSHPVRLAHCQAGDAVAVEGDVAIAQCVFGAIQIAIGALVVDQELQSLTHRFSVLVLQMRVTGSLKREQA